MRHELDHIDEQIIKLLHENARIPLKTIASQGFLAKISFYTIAGKDTNLCAMSGTGFRKWGDEHDAETNN